MRFLILGDSLTFGRPNHDIWYRDTWPGLLERSGHKVFHRGRGADSKLVLSEVRHLQGYMEDPAMVNCPFDCCFVQVGIVDCKPRLLTKTMYQVGMALPVIRKLVNCLNRKQ